MPFWRRDPEKKRIKDLDKAIKAADADAVARLLDEGASPNTLIDGNSLLFNAAYEGGDGQLAVVKLLIARGADVNARNRSGCTPFTAAAEKASAAVVAALVEAGADTAATCLSRSGRAWALEAGNLEVADMLAPKPKARPRVEGEDEVTLTRALGDRTLEEIFNFATRERISLLRDGPGGTVEAMTRESFSVIDDKDALRRAFDVYVKKGGTLAEQDVFPDPLGKTLSLPPPRNATGAAP